MCLIDLDKGVLYRFRLIEVLHVWLYDLEDLIEQTMFIKAKGSHFQRHCGTGRWCQAVQGS